MKNTNVRIIGVALLFVFRLESVVAQQTDDNLNQRYWFPASLGASYQPLSGIANRELADFSINEISGHLRLPLRGAPAFQPMLRGGVLQFAYLPESDTASQDWSHTHAFAGAGLGLATRLSREFELGAEVFGGASLSYFPELQTTRVAEGTTLGQTNVMAGAGAKIALNPSYNFSFDISPTFRYTHSLGELSTYDGLSFGIGISGAYRFGRDPDSAQSEIRAIRFSRAEVPSLFAAMQNYYAQNPIGSIVIENTESYDLTDVTVSFMQAGFMDTPTTAVVLDTLPRGEQQVVDLVATFNGNVFNTQGVTPLNGEVVVSYVARGRPVEQRHTISYELYDKNAMTWDDDRKVAAFITPSDGSVRNYASYVRRLHRDVESPFVSEALQFAMQAYNALGALGILYQPDPTAPFTQMQENTFAVDSVNLPRETLARLTGDCDDITVLFNTMLESAGYKTAFVTTPGHIYSAVNTGVRAADFAQVHPDRSLILELDGEIWVLIEITLIGQATFMEAWSTGVSEFRRYDSEPSRRGFYPTAAAQTVFKPVALVEQDLGLQYGDGDRTVRGFVRDFERLTQAILSPIEEATRETDTARSWNRYGIMAARMGNYGLAQRAFETAVRRDRGFVDGQLNLGSLFYLREEFDAALEVFKDAEQNLFTAGRVRDTTKLKVYLNLSKTHYELENYDQARFYFSQARSVDETETARFSYLGTSDEAGTARASEAASGDPILFFEDEGSQE